MSNDCLVCSEQLSKMFEKKILGKYFVSYHKCQSCSFIQTETPYWLEEAYSSAISYLDIGLISRNLHYQSLVSHIIRSSFDPKERFLDYGGGYGMFVRMMRDQGFDYYRQDIYCENLFANYFDVQDLPASERKFGLVTAFEVMEHLVDPVEELKKILAYSKNFLFSTELQPASNLEDWWYLAPETGQHIAFYTQASLQKLADRFGLYFYTNGKTLHLFTEKPFASNPLGVQQRKAGLMVRGLKKLKRIVSKPKAQEERSLLQADFEWVKQKVQYELSKNK